MIHEAPDPIKVGAARGVPYGPAAPAGNSEDFRTITHGAHPSGSPDPAEVCDLAFGNDPRAHDMAARILNEEVEHEAWFIELLSEEREGEIRPSGHFRRGTPGDGPYSKNRGLYNP